MRISVAFGGVFAAVGLLYVVYSSWWIAQPAYDEDPWVNQLAAQRHDQYLARLEEDLEDLVISAEQPLPGLLLNLTQPKRSSWSVEGQDVAVDELLLKQRHGFFVEANAGNGEDGSNTLLFEQLRDWDGLLLEPRPAEYRVLASRHRRARTLFAGLSSGSQVRRRGLEEANSLEGRPASHANYYPLNMVAAAFDRTHIDLLSLRLPDARLLFDVVHTIDFDKLTISAITLEVVPPQHPADVPRYSDHADQLVSAPHDTSAAVAILLRQGFEPLPLKPPALVFVNTRTDDLLEKTADDHALTLLRDHAQARAFAEAKANFLFFSTLGFGAFSLLLLCERARGRT
eukprot:m.477435 g.477435  ORF g.477435 m.477435 type:complete len:343 (-) comp20845_c0_seq1:2779-3807(-)